MDSDPLAIDRERRKFVRLRLRPDLILTDQRYEGRVCCVLKDPVSLRYYRFDERDTFLIHMFDGSRSVEEVREAFEERFRPTRLSLEDLESFGQTLLKSGLAYHDQPAAGRQLLKRRQERVRDEWLRKLTNVLYIEIPLFDPDPVLRWLLARLRWVFTPWFFAAGMLFVLSAVVLVVTHFTSFWQRLPDANEFFTVRNMISLWLALGVVKIAHELGHGLTCRAMGCEVHDMGALLMCLSPCLYMNVSEAWTLPEKRRRMLVGFAGVYVELLIAAGATFTWWNTTIGHPLLHNLSLNLMVLCSANTLLVNGNPLLRYDGYYVLADWLEVPNLRERARETLGNLAGLWCLGIEPRPEPPMTVTRRCLFMAYAVASYCYSWFVMFSAIWFLSRILRPYRLESIGTVMACVSLASMAGWPMYHLIRDYRRRGRLPDMKSARIRTTVVVVGGVLAFVFFVPLPVSRVRETGIVQLRPEAVEKVFITLPGTLERLHVKDGDRVRAGDIIGELRSLEIEGQLEEARTQHFIRAVQTRALQQEAAETSDTRERSRVEVGIAQAQGERRTFAKQVGLQEKSLGLMTVRSPREGVVLESPRVEEIGKRWDKDPPTPLCSVGDVRRLRVLIPVQSADFHLFQEDLGEGYDLQATIRVHGWETRTWRGRLATLPESEAKEIPAGLTTKAGGPVATRPGGKKDVHVPQSQCYLVAVDFVNAEDDAIWPGTLAQVKVHCRWRTTAWWLWRTIAAAFDLKLV